MTVYSFNLGIGWASSGVEYAQAYRAMVLRELKQPAKFVFTDLILYENIETLAKNIGFHDSEIIWIYQYLTDIKLTPNSYTIQQFELNLRCQQRQTRIEQVNPQVRRYHFDHEDQFVTVYLKKDSPQLVERAEFVSHGRLIRKDFFTYTRVMSEYYTPRNNQAYIYLRRFFNQNGSTAYEQILDGDQEMFRINNRLLYSKAEFLKYFLEKLKLTKNDICLLDRSTEIGQIIFRHHQPAKLGVVIHAEHFSESATDHDNILWNNYYDYQFTNSQAVDFFITATKKQQQLLTKQFRTYLGRNPRIYSIPVGGLQQLQQSKTPRRPASLITASRLAAEKHLDYLISAVVQAKKTIPELVFDIYGEGGQKNKLEQMIKLVHAEAYIHLRGHQELTKIYQQYQAYLSASTSEGFGLTLMEAVGSGLAMIGLNVRYGTQTFILDQQNGHLLDYAPTDTPAVIVARLAQAIVQLFTQDDLPAFHQSSYQLAKDYLLPQVEWKWQRLLEEMTND
ncbi:accessory Sec system glycosyltransferase GtfA [Liquorilactobacillus sicerae]|uniref:accessory Sec system glycosyltransferase GtfA n=1 Tax=Liquorilactobacillus sicerae TaxID=1416943 RepID=UPI0024808F56|nr:accessory Sec system glycosyltransferase GtfA [Liquorilactobacillus sicerae]